MSIKSLNKKYKLKYKYVNDNKNNNEVIVVTERYVHQKKDDRNKVKQRGQNVKEKQEKTLEDEASQIVGLMKLNRTRK